MSYREIVTKAVIAKGKKIYKNNYVIEVPEIPSTVLGCWIINHNFEGKESKDKIVINGSFDVNVWYAYDNDTKTTVATKKITYTEEETMNTNNNDTTSKDIIIRSLKQPTCTSAVSDSNNIKIEVEKELGIEIVGDTKVKVSSIDEEDDWDNLNDTEELNNINTNYIDKEIIK